MLFFRNVHEIFVSASVLLFSTACLFNELPFLYVRSKVGAKRLHAKHTYRYHTCTSKSHCKPCICKLIMKDGVPCMQNPQLLSYKITRVSTETSALGKISAQCEQYLNSFKCTGIFSLSLFTETHSTKCMLEPNCPSRVVNKLTS